MRNGWKMMGLAAVLCVAMGGCKSKRVNPDTLPGWHDASYSTLFGRLQRMPGKTADGPPVWVIKFGLASDAYRGEFAITPPEQLVGYNGGEQVEVKGVVRPELSHPDYVGNWYEVRSIRMWSNHR